MKTTLKYKVCKLLVNFTCLFSKRARKIRRLALAYSGGYIMIWRNIYKGA